MCREKINGKYREFPQISSATDKNGPPQATVLMNCGGTIITVNGTESACCHCFERWTETGAQH